MMSKEMIRRTTMNHAMNHAMKRKEMIRRETRHKTHGV